MERHGFEAIDGFCKNVKERANEMIFHINECVNFVFSKVPVCVNNYEYIYDFSNKVTVCHDKYFNELTAKLFSNEDYNSVFYEDIKN